MYHEKASYVKCASTFVHHKLMWQGKIKYACIDLIFQGSNSKTKLKVGDVFRIMLMRNYGKWDQEEAEKASRL